MPREPRAVLFDLDDTLCPLTRFLFSGFRAAAAHAADTWTVDEHEAVAVLGHAFDTMRGREIQALVERFGLPATAIDILVEVIRSHRPTMRLPHAALTALRQMRQDWRIGIVTNGRPEIQARKVDALGLRPHVDTVIFAHATGRGEGKPAPEPFLEACMRLGVTPGQAVFVGDDLTRDVDGARRVGMKTI